MTPAGGAARSFAYDASGNMVGDTRVGALGMSFEYDSERRLSKAYQTNAPGNVASYAYDAMNRLVSRSVAGGATVYYIHDIFNHIIAETDATGASLREYIWLGDMPVAVVSGANTAAPVVSYVHTDHLARPVRMTSQAGAIAWWAVYAPFGAVHATGGALQQDMRFPGQWFQLETGLAYNWNRHYDATLGRYVQPDPIGFAGGRSLYGYVGGNPLAYVDFNGLCPTDDEEKKRRCNNFQKFMESMGNQASDAASDLILAGTLEAGLAISSPYLFTAGFGQMMAGASVISFGAATIFSGVSIGATYMSGNSVGAAIDALMNKLPTRGLGRINEYYKDQMSNMMRDALGPASPGKCR